jgi:hypothetical protein
MVMCAGGCLGLLGSGVAVVVSKLFVYDFDYSVRLGWFAWLVGVFGLF